MHLRYCNPAARSTGQKGGAQRCRGDNAEDERAVPEKLWWTDSHGFEH